MRALLEAMAPLGLAAAAATPFDGALLLGAAREILLTPASEARKRESELKREAGLPAESLAWRARADASGLRARGLPRDLVASGCQPPAHLYGATAGGLPVIVNATA